MTAEEEEALDRLLFYLEHQTGFWFGLVVSDTIGPRARLRKAARAWCEEHGRAFHLHEPAPIALPQLAVMLARGAPAGLHWIRAAGPQGVHEQWDAASAKLLMAINERREAYRERLDGGVVIEGRMALKRMLRDLAPDLFSIRSFIAEPGAGPEASVLALSEWHPDKVVLNLAIVDMKPEVDAQRADWLKGMDGQEQAWLEAAMTAVVKLLVNDRFDEAVPRIDDLFVVIKRKLAASPEDNDLHLGQAQLHILQAREMMRRGTHGDAHRHLDASLVEMLSYVQGSKEIDCTFLPVLSSLYGAFCNDLADVQATARVIDVSNKYIGILREILWRVPESLDARTGLFSACLHLGGSYKQCRQFDEAKRAFREALQVAEKSLREHLDDEGWMCRPLRALNWIALCLTAEGNSGSAVRMLSDAITKTRWLWTEDEESKPWEDEFGPCLMTLVISRDRARDWSSPSVIWEQERAIRFVDRRFREREDGADFNLALLWLCRCTYLTHTGAKIDAQAAAHKAWELVSCRPARNASEEMLRSSIATVVKQAPPPRPKRKRRGRRSAR